MKPRRDDLEFRIQCTIVDLLRLKAKPDVLWFAVPNGEKRSLQTGARLKRMGVLPGVADFCFVLPPSGVAAFMEVKAGKGELSFNQLCFEAFCNGHGIEYRVVRSSYEAEEVLAEWGALRVPIRKAA